MLYERKLQSLSKLEALVGKKNFMSIVGQYVDKPKGAPVLVPDTDPRESYQESGENPFDDGFMG